MRAALIDPDTGKIVNIIVADAQKDPAPRGFVMVDCTNVRVEPKSAWTQKDGFIRPKRFARLVNNEIAEIVKVCPVDPDPEGLMRVADDGTTDKSWPRSTWDGVKFTQAPDPVRARI